MNIETIDAQNATQVNELLKTLNMQWDGKTEMLLGARTNDTISKKMLAMKMALMQQRGMGTLIHVDVRPDLNSSSRNSVYVRQSTLMLDSKSYYSSAETAEYLRQYLATLVQFSEPDIYYKATDDDFLARSKAVVDFEAQLALAMQYSSAENADLYNVGFLMAIYPEIDWKTLIEKYFTSTDGTITVPEEIYAARVIMETPRYFPEMVAALTSASTETVLDYLRCRVLFFSAPRLGNHYQKAFLEFKTKVRGVTEPTPRWVRCVRQANTLFGFALGKPFTENNFTKNSPSISWMMIVALKEAFYSDINTEWIDDATRQKVHKKVRNMIEKIGYPMTGAGVHVDQSSPDRYYFSLDIKKDDYFGNLLRYNLFMWRQEKDAMMQKVDANIWQVPPASTISYYDRSQNSIELPVGIMQPPFFKVQYPTAINFGGFGAQVANNLVHLVDNEGIYFNEDGDFTDTWWSKDMKKLFDSRAQCFEDQYSNYTVKQVDGLKVDGARTLSENIADNGGLKLAFSAYKTKIKDFPRALAGKTLPGLKETPEQLLFF
jgi:endothelin-converting enzyme